MNKEQAIELLGEYAFNARTGKELTDRIDRLLAFSLEHPDAKVTVEVNNNWSICPKHKSAKAAKRLGGTTYAYQVWAVIR